MDFTTKDTKSTKTAERGGKSAGKCRRRGNVVAGSLTILFLLAILLVLCVLRGALFRLSNSVGHPVNPVHPVCVFCRITLILSLGLEIVYTPMKSLTEHLWFEVPNRRGFVNITDTVEKLVKKSGVKEGLCLCNTKQILYC